MTAEEIIALRSIFCQPGEFTVLQDGKFNYNFPDEASLGKLADVTAVVYGMTRLCGAFPSDV